MNCGSLIAEWRESGQTYKKRAAFTLIVNKKEMTT